MVDRTLYFVTGRDNYDRVVFGGHFYAMSGDEAREIAKGFADRDRTHAITSGLPKKAEIAFYVARKSTAYANALN